MDQTMDLLLAPVLMHYLELEYALSFKGTIIMMKIMSLMIGKRGN